LTLKQWLRFIFINPFDSEVWWKNRRSAISLFIILHLTIITTFLFNSNQVTDAMVRTFVGYIYFFGLEQNFGMFSNVRMTNLHALVVATLADGTNQIIEYPRMERLNLWDRFMQERYRKLMYDNLMGGVNREYLLDYVRYVARQLYKANKDNPPRLINVFVYGSEILPPKLHQSRDSMPPQTIMENLIAYPVSERDLQ